MMCSYPLWEMLRCDLDEASGGVDDSMFVVSKLAAALLLGPQLAADALPTVPGSGADAVVLAAACAGAGGAAGKPVAVDLGRVNHWVVAHGRCSWRGKGIAHRGTRTAGVIGHCIAAAGIARCNARSRYAG